MFCGRMHVWEEIEVKSTLLLEHGTRDEGVGRACKLQFSKPGRYNLRPRSAIIGPQVDEKQTSPDYRDTTIWRLAQNKVVSPHKEAAKSGECAPTFKFGGGGWINKRQARCACVLTFPHLA